MGDNLESTLMVEVRTFLTSDKTFQQAEKLFEDAITSWQSSIGWNANFPGPKADIVDAFANLSNLAGRIHDDCMEYTELNQGDETAEPGDLPKLQELVTLVKRLHESVIKAQNSIKEKTLIITVEKNNIAGRIPDLAKKLESVDQYITKVDKEIKDRQAQDNKLMEDLLKIDKDVAHAQETLNEKIREGEPKRVSRPGFVGFVKDALTIGSRAEAYKSAVQSYKIALKHRREDLETNQGLQKDKKELELEYAQLLVDLRTAKTQIGFVRTSLVHSNGLLTEHQANFIHMEKRWDLMVGNVGMLKNATDAIDKDANRKYLPARQEVSHHVLMVVNNGFRFVQYEEVAKQLGNTLDKIDAAMDGSPTEEITVVKALVAKLRGHFEQLVKVEILDPKHRDDLNWFPSALILTAADEKIVFPKLDFNDSGDVIYLGDGEEW